MIGLCLSLPHSGVGFMAVRGAEADGVWLGEGSYRDKDECSQNAALNEKTTFI